MLNIFHSGGLWLVPLIMVIGAVLFFRKAFLASKSGGSQQVGTGTPYVHTEYSDRNVPIYKIPFFWFGVALTVAAIVSFLIINSDYKGV